MITFLKKLDQPSAYKRDECFIKRDHGNVPILAKMIRQFPGISSEKAMELAKKLKDDPIKTWFYDHTLRYFFESVYSVLGRKKDGTPKKLALDFIRYLEEGQ